MFTPLPGARAQTALVSQGGDRESGIDRGNNSFLPSIKPVLTKMNPVMRQRARDTEIAFLNELYRSAGGAGWFRQQNWCTEESVTGLTMDAWQGVVGVHVGKPGDIQYQRCLAELWLGNNNLKGSIPPAFFWQGVPQVSVLEFQHNKQLGGSFPQLMSLKRLVVLDCRGCRFEGNLPQDMPPLLQRLLMSENRFEGPIHKWACPKMRVLNLSHNKLNGTFGGVGTFAGMPELETLDIQDNAVHADYSTLWGTQLPLGLTNLNMSRNKLFGPLGTATAGAATLEYLSLAGNHLTGRPRGAQASARERAHAHVHARALAAMSHRSEEQTGRKRGNAETLLCFLLSLLPCGTVVFCQATCLRTLGISRVSRSCAWVTTSSAVPCRAPSPAARSSASSASGTTTWCACFTLAPNSTRWIGSSVLAVVFFALLLLPLLWI